MFNNNTPRNEGRQDGSSNSNTPAWAEPNPMEGISRDSRADGVSLSESAAKRGLERLDRIAAGKIKQQYGRVNFTGDEVVAIYNRDKGLCNTCGHGITSYYEASIDHVIPLALGGTNALSNLHIAHIRCNQRKFKKLATDLEPVVMHWEEAQPPLQIISVRLPGMDAQLWRELRIEAVSHDMTAGHLLSEILRSRYTKVGRNQ